MDHEFFMQQALLLARKALLQKEFPVGCVLAYQDRIIARGERSGTNRMIPSELDHAEIMALRRLEEQPAAIPREQVTLYTTLEPCLMCYGAILLSGVGTIVYAYEDAMGGGTGCDTSRLPALYRNNRIHIISSVCRMESLKLFKSFFGEPGNAYWRGSLLSRYTAEQA